MSFYNFRIEILISLVLEKIGTTEVSSVRCPRTQVVNPFSLDYPQY